jgi:hypothetical protein
VFPEYEDWNGLTVKYYPDLDSVFGVYGNDNEPDARVKGGQKIGCIVFQGAPFQGEVTNRTVPGRKHLSASSNPMCWLYADYYGDFFSGGAFQPPYVPHHIGSFGKLSIPYNVVHLDGHADMHRWDRSGAPYGPRPYYGQSAGTPYGNENYSAPAGRQLTGVDTDNDRIGRK